MKSFKFIPVVLVVAMATAGQAKLPHNSYITKPTPNKAAFLKLIQSDKTVQDRYMRHFAMNRKDLMQYMSSIKMSRLSQAGLYTVYNVPAETGELRSRLLKMKKGEPVWVDQFGQPIMVVVCGNPMTRGPKSVVAIDRPTAPMLASESTPSPARMPDEFVATAPLSPVEPATMDAFEPSMPEVARVPDAVVVPNGIVENVVTNRKSALGFLALIPLLAIKTGHSNPVPEPSSVIVLAAGASLLAYNKRRK